MYIIIKYRSTHAAKEKNLAHQKIMWHDSLYSQKADQTRLSCVRLQMISDPDRHVVCVLQNHETN